MFTELDLEKIFLSIKLAHTYEFKILTKKDKKKIIGEIDRIVTKHSIIGVHNEYARALGNATKHGSYPVKCSIYIGQRKQMICVITDSGKGFDYRKIIEKYQSGKVYYKHHGKGIKRLGVNPDLKVDWQDGGKTIILYYNAGY